MLIRVPFEAAGRAVLLIVGVGVVGCRHEEGIREYWVPKTEATAETSASPAGPSYDVPVGWQLLPTMGGMRQAAFEVRQADQKLEITIISLPTQGNDLLANVNRWRGQIQLPPLESRQQLDEQLTTISVEQEPVPYVQLTSPPESKTRESILGAIVTRGETIWFVKLRGHAELAEREREHFEQFVRSLRFGKREQPNG